MNKELLKKAEAMAEEIEDFERDYRKLELLWARVDGAVEELGRELGKNLAPDTLGESLAVLLPVIRQLPLATADVCFYAVDPEMEETVAVDTWAEAEYALLTLAGLDLREPGQWGDFAYFSERIAKLLVGTLDMSEIACTGDDRDGEIFWVYLYKKTEEQGRES